MSRTSITSSLSRDLSAYWSREFMIRATNDKQINEWLASDEYKHLWETAKAMLPVTGKYDRRTKAYRYMKWHEPRVRKQWEKTLSES